MNVFDVVGDVDYYELYGIVIRIKGKEVKTLKRVKLSNLSQPIDNKMMGFMLTELIKEFGFPVDNNFYNRGTMWKAVTKMFKHNKENYIFNVSAIPVRSWHRLKDNIVIYIMPKEVVQERISNALTLEESVWHSYDRLHEWGVVTTGYVETTKRGNMVVAKDVIALSYSIRAYVKYDNKMAKYLLLT